MSNIKSMCLIAAISLAGIGFPALGAVGDTISDEQGVKYKVLSEPAGGQPGTCEVGNHQYYSGGVVIPETVTHVNNTYTVTTIGESAFYNCRGLTSVEIGSSVTTIGENAFRSCSSLTSVEIGSSVTTIGENAFWSCSSLTSVEIRPSVTTIGSNAFSECSGLTSVEIGSSVTTIGKDAFYRCSGLTSVEIGPSVTTIGRRAFYDCSGLTSVEIGPSVTTIDEFAFSSCSGLQKLVYNAVECSGGGGLSDYNNWLTDCSNLTEVIIGDKVQTIPNYAFYKCSGLTSVEIPASVTTIGENAFRSCSGLTSVVIPPSVTTIGEWAFLNCSGLTSVEIGPSVTTIGEWAFYRCSGLQKLVYNAVECSVGGGLSDNNNWLTGCSNLSEVIIGDQVQTIPSYAFSGCSGLTSVEIPASVTTIGSGAFMGCSKIETVETPSLEAWTAIKFGNAYANPTYCAKKLLVNGETIRRLTLPADLTSLNSYAFINCEPLVTVTCGSEIKNVGSQVFSGCTGLQRISFDKLTDYLQISYLNNASSLTYGNDAEIYINGSPIDLSNVDWPAELTEIPDYAFCDCKDLTAINIPETVVSIGRGAFLRCENLKEIVLPSKISQILGETFGWCKKLKSVEIGPSVTTIGERAFYECSGLTSVEIGPSVKTIGERAFYECSGLTSVEIGPSVKTIGERAFYGCSGLKSVMIGDLQAWCHVDFGNEQSNPIYWALTFRLSGCDSPVEHLVINMPGETVSAYAFYNAKNLKTVRVEAQGIGQKAFYGCSSVTDLCVEAEEIGDNGFYGESSLKTIYSLTATPPTAADNVFSNYTGVSLYVPTEAVPTYENAENCWWRFLDVYPHDFYGIENIFTADHDLFTGIDQIVDNRPAAAVNNDVYTLGGVLVKRNATSMDVRSLSPGIYVIGGKKVLVR